jgi:hypothetical protein
MLSGLVEIKKLLRAGMLNEMASDYYRITGLFGKLTKTSDKGNLIMKKLLIVVLTLLVINPSYALEKASEKRLDDVAFKKLSLKPLMILNK